MTDAEKPCWGTEKVRSVITHCNQYGRDCTGLHYSNPNGSVDVEVYVTDALPNGLGPPTKAALCRQAWTAEPPAIDPGMHAKWERDPGGQASVFNKVLTYNPLLLQRGPAGKFGRLLEPGCHLFACRDKNPLWWQTDSRQSAQFLSDHLRGAVLSKSKGISMILSDKGSAPGHRMRHTVYAKFKGPFLAGCGHGAKNFVQDKAECLKEYMFSIVIENGMDQGYYFSEKLVDALLLGVVPIYWGNGTWVSELFDTGGLMYWETLEDLSRILESLSTPEKQRAEYFRRHRAIQCNFFKATRFVQPVWERITERNVGPHGEVNCNLCPPY